MDVVNRYEITLSSGVTHVVLSEEDSAQLLVLYGLHNRNSEWCMFKTEITINDMTQVIDMAFRVNAIISVRKL